MIWKNRKLFRLACAVYANHGSTLYIINQTALTTRSLLLTYQICTNTNEIFWFGTNQAKNPGKNVSSNETKQKEKKKLTEAVSIEHIKIISTHYLVSAHCCCCWSWFILSSADFDEYLSRLIPYAYRCSAWSHAYT